MALDLNSMLALLDDPNAVDEVTTNLAQVAPPPGAGTVAQPPMQSATNTGGAPPAPLFMQAAPPAAPQGMAPQAPSPVGGAINAGGAPPKDAAELAARKTGWMELISKLHTDPELRMATIRTGLQLVQPVAPGQTPLGHTGQAIMGGIDYLAARKEAAGKMKKTEAEVGSLQASAKKDEAMAEYYRKGGRPVAAAAKEQHLFTIADALAKANPDKYKNLPLGKGGVPAQALLDAQGLIKQKSAEELAGILFRSMYLPGQDTDEVALTALNAANALKAGSQPQQTSPVAKPAAGGAPIKPAAASQSGAPVKKFNFQGGKLVPVQ